jgi:hypothetical protein
VNTTRAAGRSLNCTGVVALRKPPTGSHRTFAPSGLPQQKSSPDIGLPSAAALSNRAIASSHHLAEEATFTSAPRLQDVLAWDVEHGAAGLRTLVPNALHLRIDVLHMPMFGRDGNLTPLYWGIVIALGTVHRMSLCDWLRARPRFSDQPSLNGSRGSPVISTYTDLVSVYSRMPSMPFSRPMPLSLYPPKGAAKLTTL